MRLKDIIDFKTLSITSMCERLCNREHFSLARFGDGEFNAILGKPGANCDAHPYYPEMGRELGAILENKPPYFIGLHENAKLEIDTLEWLAERRLVWMQHVDGEFHAVPNTSLKFVPNAVFHDALVGKDNNGHRTIKREGIIDELWLAIYDSFMPVAIVAPGYVAKQTRVKWTTFVEVPQQQTYEALDRIKFELSWYNFSGWIVLISASMTAPLIVDHLYRQYGDTATFIDFGCVFDYYVEGAPYSRNFFKYAS